MMQRVQRVVGAVVPRSHALHLGTGARAAGSCVAPPSYRRTLTAAAPAALARACKWHVPSRVARMHTSNSCAVPGKTDSESDPVLDRVVNVDVSSLDAEASNTDLDWLSHPDFEDPQQFSRHYKDALVECGADAIVAQTFHASFASQAELTKLRIQQAINKVEGRDGNVGSTAAQVAALTARIQSLIPHFQKHRKDNHGRRGLLAMVQKRRKLLQYLKRKDFPRYLEVLQTLNIRPVAGLR
ncbi:30S ribosomal protein S15 [Salpingoeca rosetta]|uniref:30S ribosomal protein S15 n=1 Tax=Salpingoeca rosetta (strain ATCC 50818 / BSB-021) TaxID=946362 RepID=F2U2A2_SALR5|nr:30S ribosomal protein S15 [Salpingoeca rosetta]EGD81754.1 30S ribosomal protein S15 [Salpingoeca rosetta]|eukprot:XP_004996958.1 30S ribosomal protein S15 [Salpingoeca rosetta]